MTRHIFTKKNGPMGLLLLAAVGCFVFFQFFYACHFFYQEQNQIFLWSQDYLVSYFDRSGALAELTGDFLTQFYYYLYAGATILSLCILAIGLLTYKALQHLGLNRWWAVVLALCLMLFTTVLNFYHGNRLSATISIAGWTLVLWLISIIFRSRKRLISLLLCGLIIMMGYPLFGIPQIKKITKPDFILEKDFAVDAAYYFGNYDEVLRIVKDSEQWTQEMLFLYNLVLAQRGELPDHLMDFTPNQLGTFYEIGPQTPLITIRNMNELYWALGDMTFTERAAMMTNVFSRNNRNVRMMRRLAECNLVSGDTLATEKYLRILDKTLVYRAWTEKIRKHGREIYQQKMALVNHHDTITVGDNSHFLMIQLLDAHPENTIALDYILCSDLLLKDIQSFKRDYDRYCMGTDETLPADARQHCKPRLKKLYQEALCIWLAGTNATQEEWQRLIQRKDVLDNFMAYNSQRGHPRFKNTYWYYFDKAKTPDI